MMEPLVRDNLDIVLEGFTGSTREIGVQRDAGPMISRKLKEGGGWLEDHTAKTNIRWLIIKPGDVIACIITGERWNPILRGSNCVGRAITILSPIASVFSEGRREIILGGDRVWVPPGVEVMIEPTGGVARLEVVAWGDGIGKAAMRGVMPARKCPLPGIAGAAGP